MFFLLFTTIFVNGVFILSTYLYQSLHTTCNYFYLNLSAINISLGTAALLTGCLYPLNTFDLETTCIFKNLHVFFSSFGMTLTMTTFTAISVERYICVFYALRCADIITKKRVVIAISVMWAFWTVETMTLRSLGLWWLHSRIYMVQFVINTLICAVINMRILKEVRRHENRISSQEQSTANAEELRRAREKKRTRTLIWIVSLVVICYIPTFIMLLSKYSSLDRIYVLMGWAICRVLYQSHTTFDILVYGIRTEEVYTSCKKILNKIRPYLC